MNPCITTPPVTGSSIVDVWVVDLYPQPRLQDSMLAFLSADERNHATTFRSYHARSAFQVARATLRLCLARYTGVSPHELVIAVGRHGKPFLAGQEARAPLRFNVSHSYGYALICFSKN